MNAVLNMKQAVSSFAVACRDILELKKIEDDAKARRYEMEKALLGLLERDAKAEGTVHAEEGRYKVTVSYKLTRAVDTDALTKNWESLPMTARNAFRWKADVDLTKLRAIQDVAPELYADLAQYITAKPAKPGIKIEEVA